MAPVGMLEPLSLQQSAQAMSQLYFAQSKRPEANVGLP